MVLDRKHFDEMDDDFCDFDDKLDASSEDLSEAGPSNPLSWRRIIIERAVSNVKKAHENKADLKVSYKPGSLVFDEEANKFGRVVESRPGFLNLSLLAGGKLVRQDINPLDFVRQNRQKLTLTQMAEKLVVPETQVMSLLNQLELNNPINPEKRDDKKPPKMMAEVHSPTKTLGLKKNVVAKVVKKAPGKPEVKKTFTKELVSLPSSKPTIKIATTTKKKPLAGKKISAKSKDLSISFTKLLPKGATTDPVMDPNGYIQQNFLLMSNRELATATGLSEHTIRRKLGEWNLKRKDFVNKA